MRGFTDSRSASPAEKGVSNERVAVMLHVMALLRQHDESEAGKKPTVPGLESVVPHLWLIVARSILIAARQPGKAALSSLAVARSFVHKALHVGWCDPEALHEAGRIVMEIGVTGSLEDDEEEGGDLPGRQKLFEEACDYLDKAARLSPARPDILNDLVHALSEQAEYLEGSQKTDLLQQAIRRSDEALACFNATNRRVEKTGELHPNCTKALVAGGGNRWEVSLATDDLEKKRTLLEQAHAQLRQGFHEGNPEGPPVGMLLGRVALDLAWLPGDPEIRRGLFEEACAHLEATAPEEDPQFLGYCRWGSAMAGRASLASGREQRKLLAKAEDLFARQVRLGPRTSEPHLESARAWLQVAAEPAAEIAKEGARRAAEAARHANSIEPGSGDYALACSLSRLGQTSEAAEALAAALANDIVDAAYALSDPDLGPLWLARPDLRQKLAGG